MSSLFPATVIFENQLPSSASAAPGGGASPEATGAGAGGGGASGTFPESTETFGAGAAGVAGTGAFFPQAVTHANAIRITYENFITNPSSDSTDNSSPWKA